MHHRLGHTLLHSVCIHTRCLLLFAPFVTMRRRKKPMSYSLPRPKSEDCISHSTVACFLVSHFQPLQTIIPFGSFWRNVPPPCVVSPSRNPRRRRSRSSTNNRSNHVTTASETKVKEKWRPLSPLRNAVSRARVTFTSQREDPNATITAKSGSLGHRKA